MDVSDSIEKLESDLLSLKQQLMKLKSNASHSYSIANLRLGSDMTLQMDRKHSVRSKSFC